MANSKQSYRQPFTEFIHQLQDEICSRIEGEDGKSSFKEELWQREEGGGGRTRVIERGNVFEKGGVNISMVHGTLPKTMQDYLQVDSEDFFACGLSLVLHPVNPFVPTVHANYRYFELYNQQNEVVDHWFGGGSDLTPYYLFEDDVVHFHTIHKTICDQFDTTFYPTFKQRCDQYFYNTHRQEGRGVGGTFFDYLREDDTHTSDFWNQFVQAMGNHFIESYLPIVQKRKEMNYTEQHKYWQELRRGRYVEFNLIHDKGTLFGLKTNGRIESILMSLPPSVRWDYNVQPKLNSEENRLIEVLKSPKDWVHL